MAEGSRFASLEDDHILKIINDKLWLKLSQGGIVLKLLTGTTGRIVMQLILGCNSKTTFS
jgi:hypothetical protein